MCLLVFIWFFVKRTLELSLSYFYLLRRFSFWWLLHWLEVSLEDLSVLSLIDLKDPFSEVLFPDKAVRTIIFNF